ncbi:MAG: Coq4 family protein [Polyangiaceae bacterium]
MNASLASHPFDEATAIQIGLNGSFFDRLRVAHRAGWALIQDSEDTRQVFLLGAAVNGPRVPQLLARFLAEDGGYDLMVRGAAIDSRHVDYDALRQLPVGTLGRAYVDFLERNDLDPDLFQAPPGLPRAIAYLAQRMRQSHDLWHVVTGYGTDVAGEIELQAFTYAQVKLPLSFLLTFFGILRHGLAHPRLFWTIFRAYGRGRRAAFLPVVDWEARFADPLSDVRRDLGLA